MGNVEMKSTVEHMTSLAALSDNLVILRVLNVDIVSKKTKKRRHRV